MIVKNVLKIPLKNVKIKKILNFATLAFMVFILMKRRKNVLNVIVNVSVVIISQINVDPVLFLNLLLKNKF